ncbi:pyruvate synthase subunit beta [Methanothermobacter sp. KEPCO-1]|uniref:Pyruvate synthase subunit PorB n=1 Tax=Methanothermobacter marburgensis (strain ATCC BAA-927 / DSM 2133 / JCM 14651 / NBRC 100331 / OCM 82 / Marburg) TaxID=79929 RepID=PORB_METTM|nr:MULTISPECIES: pyruvate synthase subunit PorB [Methanothermobacter]P80901.2 RecName: Full=Pyruvate synthase subunit PorB; AltName: Full=Pyruvate oxidoreductase beta chain; Short=POR; AltName: Full=Pyruvic-ferredoxin oxidoreductase subunit beta [Methanothermobacter marburgensis str. Marburg]ADL57919.1 pyruvate synthase, subunit B [Methanothermobacter marburgensis str. Marburg]QEF94210.1 pyruvate synthase subunit beta [Methanothermobacter sp. KEPCO-1]WBF10121.1 pyruvate synthase subunit beta [M
MKIPEEEFLAPGHRGCAGCGATVGVRLALKVLGKNTVAVSSTGCLEVITTPYPETAWEIPWIHVAFENAAAVASGVERALRARGRGEVNVVAFAGDGGTADIGLQSLSGAMERGHNIIYICYDNEAYMNTGIQRSASTPYGASTTTSPHGKESFGEDRPKKNMPLIMAAHGVPYVATASISYPEDFMEKVRKARDIEGPAYIHLHQPCTTGWGFDPSKTVELGRLAVETGSWILYEIEDGDFRVTYRPVQRKPVEEYLNAQKRFRHLTEEQKAKIQEYVDSVCQELRI